MSQILPGVKVVIANPETKGMCADSHLGEVRSVIFMLYSTKTMSKLPSYVLDVHFCVSNFADLGQQPAQWQRLLHDRRGFPDRRSFQR